MAVCVTRVVGPLFQESTDIEVFATLTSTYTSSFEAEPNLKWQYVGSQTGVYSIFPATGRSSCTDYDPRLRPWYALGATPKKKDVVLIVDVSGSMGIAFGSQSRLQVAQEAANVVLDTLNPDDRVSVLTFASFV